MVNLDPRYNLLRDRLKFNYMIQFKEIQSTQTIRCVIAWQLLLWIMIRIVKRTIDTKFTFSILQI